MSVGQTPGLMRTEDNSTKAAGRFSTASSWRRTGRRNMRTGPNIPEPSYQSGSESALARSLEIPSPQMMMKKVPLMLHQKQRKKRRKRRKKRRKKRRRRKKNKKLPFVIP